MSDDSMKGIPLFPTLSQTLLRRFYHKNQGVMMENLYTRAQRLKREYNLTLEDFEALSKFQGKLCAICKEYKTLVVDHDHDTGMVRGLLCYACNTGLGQFKDNTRFLDSAILYLENSRKPERKPLVTKEDDLKRVNQVREIKERREQTAKRRAEYHGVPYTPDYRSK